MKKLQIKNNSDNYRVLNIEPFGYKFGMNSGQSFILKITGNFDLAMEDGPQEIAFTFEKYDENLAIEMLTNPECGGVKISSGYNMI